MTEKPNALLDVRYTIIKVSKILQCGSSTLYNRIRNEECKLHTDESKIYVNGVDIIAFWNKFCF